jgi:hypothetical protein
LLDDPALVSAAERQIEQRQRRPRVAQGRAVSGRPHSKI